MTNEQVRHINILINQGGFSLCQAACIVENKQYKAYESFQDFIEEQEEYMNLPEWGYIDLLEAYNQYFSMLPNYIFAKPLDNTADIVERKHYLKTVEMLEVYE